MPFFWQILFCWREVGGASCCVELFFFFRTSSDFQYRVRCWPMVPCWVESWKNSRCIGNIGSKVYSWQMEWRGKWYLQVRMLGRYIIPWQRGGWHLWWFFANLVWVLLCELLLGLWSRVEETFSTTLWWSKINLTAKSQCKMVDSRSG